MIFVDTDIYVIDRLFPKDERYGDNARFLGLGREKCTSIFNLFELLGIASYNLNEIELKKLLKGFADVYGLEILYPRTAFVSAEAFLESLLDDAFKKMTRKMGFQDALILNIAEQYNCTRFITWNSKHFKDRTDANVQTPKEFLETH